MKVFYYVKSDLKEASLSENAPNPDLIVPVKTKIEYQNTSISEKRISEAAKAQAPALQESSATDSLSSQNPNSSTQAKRVQIDISKPMAATLVFLCVPLFTWGIYKILSPAAAPPMAPQFQGNDITQIQGIAINDKNALSQQMVKLMQSKDAVKEIEITVKDEAGNAIKKKIILPEMGASAGTPPALPATVTK